MSNLCLGTVENSNLRKNWFINVENSFMWSTEFNVQNVWSTGRIVQHGLSTGQIVQNLSSTGLIVKNLWSTGLMVQHPWSMCTGLIVENVGLNVLLYIMYLIQL